MLLSWLRLHETAPAVLAALALLPSTGRCSSLGSTFPRAIEGKGFIAVPVGTVDRPHDAARKRDAAEVVLQNMDFFYAMDISFGTPAQIITVLVDTGSAELWVNPDCNTAPSLQQARQCTQFGQYSPASSRTPPRGPFGSREIRYGDPSDPNTLTSVQLVYYADTIAMGSARILNQTFGVVTSSDGQSSGILGIAPDTRTGFEPGTPYSLVLNSLAAQGVINSRVFSLDLRHSDSETGALIYGGVDRSKFTGPLVPVPLARGMSGEFRLGATLDHITYTDSTGNENDIPVPTASNNVMLDSGTTLTRLHAAVAIPILRALNAVQDPSGYYLASCSLRFSTRTLNFHFGAATVRVPLSDFILALQIQDLCYVGLVTTTHQQILGDSFLRAGYFVFDWDNQNVHIAQAANCGSDIIAAGSGTNAVPSMTGNCASTDSQPSATRTTGRATSAVSITTPVTTTFTVSNCPLFDFSCRTGVVTTQTLLPTLSGVPELTVTQTAGVGPTAAPSKASSLHPGGGLGLLLAAAATALSLVLM